MATTELSPADAERIAQRYPRSKRRWPLIVVPLAALLVIWTTWAGLNHANTGITGELQGYVVVSDSQVDVTINIYRPTPSKPATCLVIAQALSGQVVGQVELDVPASTERNIQVKTTVRTVDEAITAVLQGCTLS